MAARRRTEIMLALAESRVRRPGYSSRHETIMRPKQTATHRSLPACKPSRRQAGSAPASKRAQLGSARAVERSQGVAKRRPGTLASGWIEAQAQRPEVQ